MGSHRLQNRITICVDIQATPRQQPRARLHLADGHKLCLSTHTECTITTTLYITLLHNDCPRCIYTYTQVWTIYKCSL